MDDETKPPFESAPAVEKSEPDPTASNGVESHLFSISLRGILALLLVGTLSFIVIKFHTDKLFDAFLIIVSGAVTFYFGQNSKR